jgi:hypothetical protein
MWKWFMCLLTTCIVQAIDEVAIATSKAYYLRNKFEQVGGPTEEGFKDIMGREQHSSGNTGH